MVIVGRNTQSNKVPAVLNSQNLNRSHKFLETFNTSTCVIVSHLISQRPWELHTMKAKHVLSCLLLGALTLSVNAVGVLRAFNGELESSALQSRQSQPYCNTSQISAMDVGSCACRNRTSTKCTPTPTCAPACNHTVVKDTKSCTEGCTDIEADCTGCGVWFHMLCDCLKDQKNCSSSGTIGKGASAVWAHLKTAPTEHDLITTNNLIPGIEKLSGPHGDNGWVYAQQEYTEKQQALVLNSYRSRTHEQVHIHLCPRNNITYWLLGNETAVNTSSVQQLTRDKQLYCFTLVDGSMATKFASTVQSFLSKPLPGVCDVKLVGAAIQKDSRNRTWGCVTSNSDGPLAKFCGS